MNDHAIARGLPGRRLSVLLMYAPMTLQRKTISKRRRTYFTLVRLLTGVHLGVVLQMCRLRECRATYFTFVWLLTSVYATMIPQCSMARKSLVAHPTHIRTLSAVGAFVVLEMWRLGELHATRLAPGKEKRKQLVNILNSLPEEYVLVGLLARVNTRMILQIDSLGKGQSTDGALIVLLPTVQFLVRPQTGIA